MSERPRESRSRTLVRFAGITVAFALTIVAAWLIALGNSKQQSSLGVIIGLWAALIGAMTFFGGRGAGTLSSPSLSGTGAEVELRQDFALELQREVSARRAYEQQLHEMVRREIETIQRVVGDQLGRLRDDVATLRGDLVDQVGGKIRLERIETTRVIGSDIEALQNEVRQLAGGRITDQVNRPAEPPARIVEQRPIEQRPAPRPGEQPANQVADAVGERLPDRRAAQRGDDRRGRAPGSPGAAATASIAADPIVPIVTPPPAAAVTSTPVSAVTSAPVSAVTSAPVSAVTPPPRPDPIPAYTPYIAPTYAPAVTYAAGSLEPQYSGPPNSASQNSGGSPATPSLPPLTMPASAPLSAPHSAPTGAPTQPTSYPSFSQQAASSPDSSLPRLTSPPSFELPQPSVLPPSRPATPVQPLPPLSAPAFPPAATTGSNGYGASIGASPDTASDPFAGLPRLSRFEDDDPLLPLAPQSQPWESTPAPVAPPVPAWQSPVEQWTPPATETGNGASTEASNGASNGRRHGAPEEAPPSAPAVGRRRRAEGDTDDVLARLLGRSS